jgi:hypothetical protein
MTFQGLSKEDADIQLKFCNSYFAVYAAGPELTKSAI